MKGLKEIFQTYESQTHTGIAVIKYGTVDFKQKLVRRDKGHFIIINGTIHSEEIKIVIIYMYQMLAQPISLNKH
jgi:hypothetical protein